MNTGFIKLHRKMTEWEWYDDANTFRLFVHFILKANHKDKKWRGVTVKRGTFITGYDVLSKELKLSKQQIRTALGKLKSTGEVTHQPKQAYSLVTIVNYDSYQDRNSTKTKQVTPQATGKQHPSNTLVTPTKNVKNVKNNNITLIKPKTLDYSSWPSQPSQQVLADWLQMRIKLKATNSQTAINRLAKQLHVAVENGMTVDECLSECVLRAWKGFNYEWTDDAKEKSKKPQGRQFKEFPASEEIDFNSTGWSKPNAIN